MRENRNGWLRFGMLQELEGANRKVWRDDLQGISTVLQRTRPIVRFYNSRVFHVAKTCALTVHDHHCQNRTLFHGGTLAAGEVKNI